MVDLATVLFAGAASLGGALVTVVLERRRETSHQLRELSDRLREEELRRAELELLVEGLRPAVTFFNSLAQAGLMRRRGGKR